MVFCSWASTAAAAAAALAALVGAPLFLMAFEFEAPFVPFVVATAVFLLSVFVLELVEEAAAAAAVSEANTDMDCGIYFLIGLKLVFFLFTNVS